MKRFKYNGILGESINDMFYRGKKATKVDIGLWAAIGGIAIIFIILALGFTLPIIYPALFCIGLAVTTAAVATTAGIARSIRETNRKLNEVRLNQLAVDLQKTGIDVELEDLVWSDVRSERQKGKITAKKKKKPSLWKRFFKSKEESVQIEPETVVLSEKEQAPQVAEKTKKIVEDDIYFRDRNEQIHMLRQWSWRLKNQQYVTETQLISSEKAKELYKDLKNKK